MKEKILEILNEDTCHCVACRDESAEDITAIVVEFAGWCIPNAYLYRPTKTINIIESNLIVESVDELFNYWLTNIYKK